MNCDFEYAFGRSYECKRCGHRVPDVRVLPIYRRCDSLLPSTACLPGTELRSILGRFGLTASGDCKCRSRAALMDANGCDWCEANIEEIAGWLRESAADRGLPFVDMAARLLVRRAIANARKAEARRAKEAEAAAAEGRPA